MDHCSSVPEDTESDSRRTSGKRLSTVSSLLAIVGGCLVVYSGLRATFDDLNTSTVFLVFGLLLLAVSAGVAVVERSWLQVLCVVAITVISTGIAIRGESIRWRWSNEELLAVAADPDEWQHCSSLSPCAVGWWRIGEVQPVESAVFIAAPSVAPLCEGGGIALPVDGASLAQVEADLAEETGTGVAVTAFRGPWLSVCYYS